MHPIVELAVKAINAFVKEEKKIEPPTILSDEMKEKAGVFVSIHRGGALMGCIGTMVPTRANVAEEVIANAIAAASQDPRFPPVTEKELAELSISVDILGKPEKVKDVSQLNVKKYGVIVESGGKKGLLLPDIEGVNTPEQQIEVCKKKAWIDERENVEIYRFEVRIFH